MKTRKPSLFSDLQGAPLPLAWPVGPEENREGLRQGKTFPGREQQVQRPGGREQTQHSRNNKEASVAGAGERVGRGRR